MSEPKFSRKSAPKHEEKPFADEVEPIPSMEAEGDHSEQNDYLLPPGFPENWQQLSPEQRLKFLQTLEVEQQKEAKQVSQQLEEMDLLLNDNTFVPELPPEYITQIKNIQKLLSLSLDQSVSVLAVHITHDMQDIIENPILFPPEYGADFLQEITRERTRYKAAIHEITQRYKKPLSEWSIHIPGDIRLKENLIHLQNIQRISNRVVEKSNEHWIARAQTERLLHTPPQQSAQVFSAIQLGDYRQAASVEHPQTSLSSIKSPVTATERLAIQVGSILQRLAEIGIKKLEDATGSSPTNTRRK